MMLVGVLTISDRAAVGTYVDESGPALIKRISQWDAESSVRTRLVSDEVDQIIDVLTSWCDVDGLDLIVTTGGTGISRRDITPEATRAVIQREIPGLSEQMRAIGISHTPMASLARQVCGHRGHTLIINLPGSVNGAVESFGAVEPVLHHAIELLKS